MIREQGISLVAQERAALVERQLNIAQERLSSFQGTQVIDNVIAAETAQKDVTIERLLAVTESLKNRLLEADQHTGNYISIF